MRDPDKLEKRFVREVIDDSDLATATGNLAEDLADYAAQFAASLTGSDRFVADDWRTQFYSEAHAKLEAAVRAFAAEAAMLVADAQADAEFEDV